MGFNDILKRLFGNKADRDMKELLPIVSKVNAEWEKIKGVSPAVVALIAAPTFSMAKSAKINRYTVWIPIVSALLIWVLDVSPVYIIIIAGVGGFIYGKYKHKYSSK